ncbi:glycosyltransferase family 4 protein [Cryomorpha ignava]|uniref:Glycosyltransferase family 4 protein n=1 Tax=Cryomorpha ignava TaxID=101383 RepID=A0A7K3WMK3_9FLAO|nr:glycosyltransferase family 4 protein [Cryomorpha ignava]NEN22877.1 glycosyltransferase family 4 protein [Cryomorpha ignava]
MADKHLHIVSFDIPYPADYGGVIDVYYRIKALSEVGVKVHLHCFEYGRSSSDKLESLCETVHYYKRSKSPRHIASKLPFIVETRRSEELLKNLLKDSHPILFEGLHTTAYLKNKALKGRLKLVRAHNIEHDYYKKLAESEKNAFKRLFFTAEAGKLKRYESVLKNADYVLSISEKDQKHFEKLYGNSTLINPFHSNTPIEIGGKQAYAFYHGNLTVAENKNAVAFLINDVFPLTEVPLLIAGKGATKAVRALNPNLKNLKVVDSPNNETMLNLAKNASVHVLPTFQNTGFKLKLLYSLFTAPVIIANEKMVAGTNLKSFCEIANTPQEMADLITAHHKSSLDTERLKNRLSYIQNNFSNRDNALKIKSLLV